MLTEFGTYGWNFSETVDLEPSDSLIGRHSAAASK
jgi:hypothetical protein